MNLGIKLGHCQSKTSGYALARCQAVCSHLADTGKTMPDVGALKLVRATKKSAKEILAHHEAGHAVVAYLLHRLVRSVTIIRGEDTLGCCYLAKGKEIHPDYDNSHKTRLELERRAMVAWGGNVAESLFTGRKPVADQDMHSVVDYLSYLTSDDEEIGAYADWLRYRTKSLLQFQRHWAAVDALATELVKNSRVGQKRTREIIHHSVHNLGSPQRYNIGQKEDGKKR